MVEGKIQGIIGEVTFFWRRVTVSADYSCIRVTLNEKKYSVDSGVLNNFRNNNQVSSFPLYVIQLTVASSLRLYLDSHDFLISNYRAKKLPSDLLILIEKLKICCSFTVTWLLQFL